MSRWNSDLDAVTAPVPLEWEETDCPLCGSEDWSPLMEASDPLEDQGLRFLVVQCRHCELCFTNPRPTPASIGHFYPEDYKPHHKEAEPDSGRPRFWHRFLPFSRRGRLRRSLPVTGQGRLLDFGCGGGSFLLRMRSQGWNITGVDTSLATVERLRAQGLEVHHGSLPHPALEEDSFDLITMWASLEHVHRPLEVLQAARSLLVPGGQVLVLVPNVQSFGRRWFGPAWHGLDLPRHLTHFSPSTLRHMLHRAGFESDRVRMVRSSSQLRQSARLARRAAVRPGRWASFLGTRIGSNLASWYCYLAGKADGMIATATRPPK